MNDDTRTIYCGNLSDKVTEEILYELFLQGGPIQKINIPKDRDGKQRPFGFITYKHIHSVDYALRLFNGTTLYNRLLNMKQRNTTESQQEKLLNPVCNVNHMLEQGQQMILGNYPPRINGARFGTNGRQNNLPQSRQSDENSGNDDKNLKRNYFYHRERERNRERERERGRDRDRTRDRERSRERNHNDHYKDERSYYRDNNHRSTRCNDNRKRWTYH